VLAYDLRMVLGWSPIRTALTGLGRPIGIATDVLTSNTGVVRTNVTAVAPTRCNLTRGSRVDRGQTAAAACRDEACSQFVFVTPQVLTEIRGTMVEREQGEVPPELAAHAGRSGRVRRSDQ
jgi:hypothetical protein